MDDYIIFFDGHFISFGLEGSLDQFPAMLDRCIVFAHPDGTGLAKRLAGADIELPSMPRAFDEFPGAAESIFSGLVSLRKTDNFSCAERSALMGASVAQGEVVAVEVEDCHGSAANICKFALAGLYLIGSCDDETGPVGSLGVHARP